MFWKRNRRERPARPAPPPPPTDPIEPGETQPLDVPPRGAPSAGQPGYVGRIDRLSPRLPQPPPQAHQPPAGRQPPPPTTPPYPPRQPPAPPRYAQRPAAAPRPAVPERRIIPAGRPLNSRERHLARQPAPKPRRRLRPGCIPPLLVLLAVLGVGLVYLLAPMRTNLLVIGVDYIDPAIDSAVARTDTIMIASIVPLKPYVGLLSIPRDLWVDIPGVGENRINTAHFFAESQKPGSGPAALQETIRKNFGVRSTYYVRIRFEGFRDVVDALGGVDIVLTQPMAGYPAGKHHLTGRKALAFVRDRANSDDFFRMSQGQFMLRSLLKNLLNPLKWLRLPAVVRAFFNSIDTNLPAWQWPRLGLALLRAGPDGIDNHVVNREMVTPFVTNEGASVLLPNWEKIRPLTRQIFGK